MSGKNPDAAELARQSAELHARIDTSSRANPATDQHEAAFREARRLAPRENSVLRLNPKIQSAIHVALSRLDPDVEAQGTVPVIRLRPMFGEEGSAEHTRQGSAPVADRFPVRYCNGCEKPTSQTVPFWIACGVHIVQVDLCGVCADYYYWQEGAVFQ